MSITTDFERELNASGHFDQDGETRRVRVGTPAGDIVCDLRALDSLGCAFDQVTLESPTLEKISFADLTAVATALVEKITYLYEPLAIIEADVELGVIQLRSRVPSYDGNDACYFEIVVGNGKIIVNRFRKGTDQRVIEPAPVTRQVLTRFVDDLANATCQLAAG